ncbi:glycosyltransferase [Chitinophaga tropicalis]|uniref:Glycosyltransferase n=1 Tax=Chitinophaga tropicalis TaxID=2683588 RepID=A0A7K1U2I9_9BACT|nr:glycosyltransferase [Chitinophaga tropicalis]MVT08496.1 glycosyltransferase [Chitinophaga tropicalis]
MTTMQHKPRLKIFTWHIHGSYLYYLSQGNFDIYIPVNEQRTPGYYGRGKTFPFGSNVHEIPVKMVKDFDFDCILYQSTKDYLVDQYEILSPAQRRLPRIYLEHNTPAKNPVTTRHVVNDRRICLVHVTHYNRLMWDNNRTPVTVIEHGVTMPEASYTGELAKGIIAINHLAQRGRALGWDIFRQVRDVIPLDLAGMGNGEAGIGEVLHPQLSSFMSKYRFYFHPVRNTSLALAVCEAMMLGMPVVGLATTELVTVIENGRNGFIHTDINYLIKKMKLLLNEPELAAKMGEQARSTAMRRFNIERFTAEWERLFHAACNGSLNELTYTTDQLSGKTTIGAGIE